LLDLRQAQAVGDKFVWVDANLVFARRAAEAGDVDNIRDRLEIFLDDPVFEGFQLHGVIGGIGAVQREEINLADRAPVRAHLRIHAGRQSDLAQALENALAIPVVVGIVVEDELEIGESEEREGTQMDDVRNAVHYDFERNRDLLFDLFRRNPWPLCNDLDVVVGHVGIGLDGQPLERNNPAGEKDQRQTKDEQAVVKSKVNDPANHLLLPFIAPTCFAIPKRSRRLDLQV